MALLSPQPVFMASGRLRTPFEATSAVSVLIKLMSLGCIQLQPVSDSMRRVLREGRFLADTGGQEGSKSLFLG